MPGSGIEEAIVRNPVRKFVGVALMGFLGALFALPMLAAGAQEFVPGEGPPPTPECNITSFSPAAPVAGELPAPALMLGMPLPACMEP